MTTPASPDQPSSATSSDQPAAGAAPKRQLTLFDSTCIIVGIIIGAGVYQMAPAIAGCAYHWWGVMAIWCVGGLLSLCGASVYAELATAYPREGGDYVYLTRAYGRWSGFLFGWMQLAVVRPGDIAVMAFIFATYAGNLFNPASQGDAGVSLRIWACAAVVALTLINVVGVRQGKSTQNLLTVVKALGLAAIIGVAVIAPHSESIAPHADPRIVIAELNPESPAGVEFQNVSGRDIDVSGWQVLVCDGDPQPRLVASIPSGTVCPADAIFAVREEGTAPGEYPDFFAGTPIRWTWDGPAAVLLLDAGGEVVDFLAVAGLDPTQIDTPAAIVPDHWQGDAVQGPSSDGEPDRGSSYQRGRLYDYDRAADWGRKPSSLGEPNSGEFLAVALIMVLFTFGGWNEMAYVAAEVKDPRRNIVRALVLGTVTVTVLYLLINAAFLYTLGYHGLATSGAVATDAVSTVFPTVGGRLIAALICISALGTVNGLVFTGARISYAAGADHRAFRVLGRWDSQRGTPARALLLQGALAVILILTLGDFLRTLIYTAAAVYLFYVGTCLALIVLRRKDPQIERPYRVTGYPLTPLIFSAVCGWLIYRAILYKPEVSLAALGIVALGLPLYWLTRQREASAEQESTSGISP